MPNATTPPKKQRGSSLIEVLIATVVLTLAFLFISGDMIASTNAENESANHGYDISVGDYLLGVMRTDGNFWSEQAGGVWSSPPPFNDPCGNPWPPYDDSYSAPTGHTLSGCSSGPFANLAGHGNYQYMWRAQEQSDPKAADLSVWVQANQLGSNSGPEIYEVDQLRREDPAPNASGLNPPSPSATPTPTPTPSKSPTPTPSPTPKPSPTPTKSPTPKPSPTPTPSPTPKPSPTVVE
jgi:hypothetical protein